MKRRRSPLGNEGNKHGAGGSEKPSPGMSNSDMMSRLANSASLGQQQNTRGADDNANGNILGMAGSFGLLGNSEGSQRLGGGSPSPMTRAREQATSDPKSQGGAETITAGGSVFDMLGLGTSDSDGVRLNGNAPPEVRDDGAMERELESNVPENEKDVPGWVWGGSKTGGDFDWLFAGRGPDTSGQATESSEDPLRDQSDVEGVGAETQAEDWWPELGGAPDDMQGCYDWATEVFTNLMGQSSGGIPDKNTFIGGDVIEDDGPDALGALSASGALDKAAAHPKLAGKAASGLLSGASTALSIFGLFSDLNATASGDVTALDGFTLAKGGLLSAGLAAAMVGGTAAAPVLGAAGALLWGTELISDHYAAKDAARNSKEYEGQSLEVDPDGQSVTEDRNPDDEFGSWPKTVEMFLLMVDELARDMNDYMNGAIDFGEFGREQNNTSIQDMLNARAFAAGTHTTPDPDNQSGATGTGESLGAGMPTEICPLDVSNSFDGPQHGQEQTRAMDNHGKGKNINLGERSANTLDATFSEDTEDALGLNDITEADYADIMTIVDSCMPVQPESAEQWFEEAEKFLKRMTDAIGKLIEAGNGRLWN
jgi:hypothetical protein